MRSEAPDDRPGTDEVCVRPTARSRPEAGASVDVDVRAESSPRPDTTTRPFAYALLRVVPSVERGERLNAGVVLFCRQHDFLAVDVRLDARRLRALAPACDVDGVRAHLAGLARVAAGDRTAGRLGAAEASERFGWIVAPSSTAVQPSAVHTGLTADPAATLDRLAGRLVG